MEQNPLIEKLRSYDDDLDVDTIIKDLEISSLILNHPSYNSHFFHSANFYTEFDTEGNYCGRYELKGWRIAKGITEEILVQIGASFPMSKGELPFKAGSPRSKEDFIYYCRDDKDLRKKVFSFFIKPPVKQSENIEFWYDFKWPEIGNDPGTTGDIINLKQYSNNRTPMVKHTLVFPYKIKDISLVEIVDNNICLSSLKVEEKKDGQKHVYEYQSDKCDVDAFLIFWRKDLANK